jgi:hypothetical protein
MRGAGASVAERHDADSRAPFPTCRVPPHAARIDAVVEPRADSTEYRGGWWYPDLSAGARSTGADSTLVVDAARCPRCPNLRISPPWPIPGGTRAAGPRAGRTRASSGGVAPTLHRVALPSAIGWRRGTASVVLTHVQWQARCGIQTRHRLDAAWVPPCHRHGRGSAARPDGGSRHGRGSAARPRSGHGRGSAARPGVSRPRRPSRSPRGTRGA